MTPDAPVYWYDEIDSTNEEVRRRARAGDTGPFWIAARAQSAGRGRLGRNWVSPPGNLFTTAFFTEPGGLGVASRVPFAAGLAIIDVCRVLVPGTDVRLKWPNDVRVDGAKLCGILVESGERHGNIWVAAGMGLNVATAPQSVGQPTTSLHELGAGVMVNADIALDALRPAFAARLAQARQDFPKLLSDWLQVGEGVGKLISAGSEGARVQGVFETLAEDGGLVLRLPNGETRIIRAGDVELVKQVD